MFIKMLTASLAAALILGTPFPSIAVPSNPAAQGINVDNLFDLATVLIAKKDRASLEEAAKLLKEALKDSDFHHQKKSGIYITLGQIQRELGYWQDALKYFNQANSYSDSIPSKKLIFKSIISKNIGEIYLNSGDEENALETLKETISITERAREDSEYSQSELTYLKFLEADTLVSLATIDFFSRKEDSLETSEKAFALIADEKVNDNDPDIKNYLAIRARVQAARGAAQYDLNNKEEALELYEDALKIYEKSGDRTGQAQALYSISGVYNDPSRNLEDPNQTSRNAAANKLRRALSFVENDPNPTVKSRILTALGAVYDDLGDNNAYIKELALNHLNDGFKIAESRGDRSGQSAALAAIGDIYYDLNDYAQAEMNFDKALEISKAIHDRFGIANIQFSIAKLQHKQNRLPQALSSINEAINIVESIRSELKYGAFKTSFFASKQGYYQLKIQILMKMHSKKPTGRFDVQAFETSDQSRARLLRELLIQANANINKDIDLTLRQQEQILNQTIDAKEKQLIQLSSQSKQNAQLAPLDQEIESLYGQRDKLKNRIRMTNPAYANLQYPKSTTLKEIQQQLDSDTLMLQYSLGETESYLWAISQNTLKTYILPKRADIEKTADQFLGDLKFTKPKSAIRLAQQILAPAAAELDNKRLVIIPDGKLHEVPFAALSIPNSKTYNPLIVQHEIINLPSASTIGILRTTVATKPRAPKQLAILADPIFTKDDDRLKGKTIQSNNHLDLGEKSARSRIGRNFNLARLPATTTEAKGILALVPNQDSISAFGFDASYDWITDHKISQYRYVHLATHGFFDNDKPALSSIVLSSFDAQGRDRRAFLRFPDLFNLNLPTELVVLSACETGLGNNIPGEGLVGMTRGLMYAGALRVAVSLWSVDDQSTSELMQDFYTNLWRSKKSHAASLREAQLKMWKQGKAPYYWAAFTLQGEWRD
jgi:CHAT domain-containing protein/predicted negative regulator of RcsB-dependent stress response